MNIKCTLAAALALTATSAFAHAQSSTKAKTSASTSGTMKVISTESINGDDQSVIEVRIDNGKVTVKRNGKEVPQNRIQREDDGRIIILDDNGDPIDNLHLFGSTGGKSQFRFHGGNADAENNVFWLGDETGEAPKVMLGVHMTQPGEALEKHLHLKSGKSTMITGVFEGLPAEVAGIGEYDIIVRIDDSDVADAGTIRKVLTTKKPGDSCSVRVIQGGESKDIKIKLLAYDSEKLGSAKLIGKEPDDMAFGSRFGPLNEGMSIDLKGLGNLAELKDRVFVAPDFDVGEWKQQWTQLQPQLKQLQPQIEKSIQDALKNYQGAIKLQQGDSVDNHSDVESQLDRLDKRLEQLEAMLEKLIEKQQRP